MSNPENKKAAPAKLTFAERREISRKKARKIKKAEELRRKQEKQAIKQQRANKKLQRKQFVNKHFGVIFILSLLACAFFLLFIVLKNM